MLQESVGEGWNARPLHPLTHSSSSTPSKESWGSGSSRFPSFATMAFSSWESQEKRREGTRTFDPQEHQSPV